MHFPSFFVESMSLANIRATENQVDQLNCWAIDFTLVFALSESDPNNLVQQ